MNLGQKYHRIKSDELSLMREVLRRHDESPFEFMHGDGAAYESIGMHPERAYIILCKWSDRRWWGWGVSPLFGWFEPAGPKALREILAWHDAHGEEGAGIKPEQ